MADHIKTVLKMKRKQNLSPTNSIASAELSISSGLKHYNASDGRSTLTSSLTEYEWTGSGIVYCHSRNSCVAMASVLCSAGIPCLPYHAGLDAEKRNEHQEKWINDEIPVLAATIAFGMGVDKASVR